jgi:hypothetical protein
MKNASRFFKKCLWKGIMLSKFLNLSQQKQSLLRKLCILSNISIMFFVLLAYPLLFCSPFTLLSVYIVKSYVIIFLFFSVQRYLVVWDIYTISISQIMVKYLSIKFDLIEGNFCIYQVLHHTCNLNECLYFPNS